MTPTYLLAATFQRMVHIAVNPYEVARQISASQFRPKEKPDVIEREHPEHSND
jgi:hypothetical protein